MDLASIRLHGAFEFAAGAAIALHVVSRLAVADNFARSFFDFYNFIDLLACVPALNGRYLTRAFFGDNPTYDIFLLQVSRDIAALRRGAALVTPRARQTPFRLLRTRRLVRVLDKGRNGEEVRLGRFVIQPVLASTWRGAQLALSSREPVPCRPPPAYTDANGPPPRTSSHRRAAAGGQPHVAGVRGGRAGAGSRVPLHVRGQGHQRLRRQLPAAAHRALVHSRHLLNRRL